MLRSVTLSIAASDRLHASSVLDPVLGIVPVLSASRQLEPASAHHARSNQGYHLTASTAKEGYVRYQ